MLVFLSNLLRWRLKSRKHPKIGPTSPRKASALKNGKETVNQRLTCRRRNFFIAIARDSGIRMAQLMQLKQQHFAGSARCSRLRSFVRMLTLVGLARSASAQNVLAPTTPNPLIQALTNRPALTRSEAQDQLTALPVEQLPSMFIWGPVRLRPHVDYRLSYGDGIQAAPGQQLKTFINQISPGVMFELGNHWTLDYTPTLRYYSNSGFRDTFDNAVILHGATTYEDWSLGLSQTYASYSQPLIETGAQTDTDSYVTSLNALYQMSSKMSLELAAYQNFRLVGENNATTQLTDFREWSTLDWLNYQFWPDFGAAVGAGFGYDALTIGSDITYEQFQGRLNWRPGTKLIVQFSAGFEVQQFVDPGTVNVTPLFQANISYQIFDGTTLSLDAGRVVAPSYIANSVDENLHVGGGLHQRLFKKLYLDLSGGYRETSFVSTSATSASVNRTDHGTYFGASLSLQVLKRGTASVFYYLSNNSSDQAGFAYSSSQVGFELAYRF
jgi:hypothetical protein